MNINDKDSNESLLEIIDPVNLLDDLFGETVIDIIPQLPGPIKINEEDLLPNLDELAVEVEPATTTYEQIMEDIESTVNFQSQSDALNALNNPEILMNRIQSAFDKFKEKTGRNMTYSEMRSIMG
jgi:PleD family two-component response regulator